MMNTCWRNRVVTLGLFAVPSLLASGPSAHATRFFWQAPQGGLFTTPSNWGPIGVPDDDDTAIFNLGIAAYTVTFPGGGILDPPPDYVVNYLRVQQNDVTFRDNSSPFITSPSLTVVNPDVSIVIGQDAGEVSVLNTTLRSLSGANTSIGRAAGATGTLNVMGGAFSVSGMLDVGDSGTGSMSVTGAGRVSSNQASVGRSFGSLGMAAVSGAGSSWTNNTDLVIGDGGPGTLTIQGGATASTTNATIGRSVAAGSEITVTGAGSTWICHGYLEVAYGFAAAGMLNVRDGGAVTCQRGTIGVLERSVGRVTVSGAGSTWTDGGIVVGYEGNGALTIQDGGRVISSLVEVGLEQGSVGSVGVDGAGSALNCLALVFGDDSVFSVGGTGAVYLRNGGTVAASSGIHAGRRGTIRSDGTGNITGSVVVDGVIAPGNLPGRLRIEGDYRHMASNKNATLLIELGSPVSFAKLEVTGNVDLRGAVLEVILLGGYQPAAGAAFDVLDWGGVLSGEFDVVLLPPLAPGLSWDTAQLYTAGVLSVSGTPVPTPTPNCFTWGDMNGDGIAGAVDAAQILQFDALLLDCFPIDANCDGRGPEGEPGCAR